MDNDLKDMKNDLKNDLLKDIEDIRDFEVGELCFMTLPCMHYVTITKKDGTKRDIKHLCGCVIYRLYRRLNRTVPKHFKNYDSPCSSCLRDFPPAHALQ